MSITSIDTTFVIVAVSLPIEDLKVLVGRALVVARCVDTGSGIMDLMELTNWRKGTGLISGTRDSSLSPEEFACTTLDTVNPTLLQEMPESLKLYRVAAEYREIRPHITKIEIYGVGQSNNLERRLRREGFGNIEYSEFGCIAERKKGQSI